MKTTAKTENLVADAIMVIQAWIAQGKRDVDAIDSLFSNAARAFRAAKKLANAADQDQPIFWRATDRKAEFDEVAAGKQIISTNYAEGYREKGMSVSESLAYAGSYGYKYAYQVTGDVVASGSDGEPVLRNCKVVGKIRKSDTLLKADKEREFAVAIEERLIAATGISKSDALQLSMRGY